MIAQEERLWLRRLALVAAMVISLGSGQVQQAAAQENRFGFGADLGVWTGTVDDEVFALGFNLDYYLSPAFSFGPMLLLAPGGDLTEVALAGVARFHVPLKGVNLVPFAGVGFVHADLDRDEGPGRIDRNDTSHYIPLGLAAEFPVSDQLALSSTLLVNLHNLELDPPVADDETSVALMFGMRFGP